MKRVNFQRTNPKDRTLHNHLCENLKSYLIHIFIIKFHTRRLQLATSSNIIKVMPYVCVSVTTNNYVRRC
jgi:hypothetical protein